MVRSGLELARLNHRGDEQYQQNELAEVTSNDACYWETIQKRSGEASRVKVQLGQGQAYSYGELRVNIEVFVRRLDFP